MAILYNYSAYVVSTVWCYSNFITIIIIINVFKYPFHALSAWATGRIFVP